MYRIITTRLLGKDKVIDNKPILIALHGICRSDFDVLVGVDCAPEW